MKKLQVQIANLNQRSAGYMTQLNKILLAVVIVLILIAGAVGFMLWRRTQSGAPSRPQDVTEQQALETGGTTLPVQQNNTKPSQGATPLAPADTAAIPIAVRDRDDVEIENAAKRYAEIFGTGSTQSNYANFTLLLPLSTTRMKNWLQQTIDTNAVSSLAGVAFKGVTTRAMKSTIEAQTERSATVIVRTQRIEEAERLEPNVYQQEIKIEMRRVEGEWLVDGAFWGEIK